MEIECYFKPIGEYGDVLPAGPDDKKKLGIYEGCYLPIENFGFKKWSVVAYLIPTKGIEYYLNEGLEEQEIVERCLTFLNKPPTKRHRKSLYGTLEIYKFYFQKDKNRISISLLTDQKKNKHFWGKGVSGNMQGYSPKGRRKRGRKK
jgi:hypothetical protein